jgi:Acyl-CoA dehydrogenase, C-terminal domain
MDFDLDQLQTERITRLHTLVDETGGADRARDVGGQGEYDANLDAHIADSDLLTGASPIEATLLVEEAARLGLAVDLATRALLLPELGLDPARSVGVVDLRVNDRGTTDRPADALVRFGASVDAVVVLDGDHARLVATDREAAHRVPSSFGYPYARISLEGPAVDLAADVPRLRRHRLLGLCAEASGASAGGVSHVGTHLRNRTQFGKPLAYFQALRHRLAQTHVTAESLSWLTRQAAWRDDQESILGAAAAAFDAGCHLPTELSQLCGARSFAMEFGLHVFTMRLAGTRLELGSIPRIAAGLAS